MACAPEVDRLTMIALYRGTRAAGIVLVTDFIRACRFPVYGLSHGAQ